MEKNNEIKKLSNLNKKPNNYKKLLLKTKKFKEDDKKPQKEKLSNEDQDINSEDYISSSMLDVETNTYIHSLTNNIDCDFNSPINNNIKLKEGDFLTTLLQKNFNKKELTNDVIEILNIKNFDVMGRLIKNNEKNNINGNNNNMIINVNEESLSSVYRNVNENYIIKPKNNTKNKKNISKQKTDKINKKFINFTQTTFKKNKNYDEKKETIKNKKNCKNNTKQRRYSIIPNEKNIIILKKNKLNNKSNNYSRDISSAQNKNFINHSECNSPLIEFRLKEKKKFNTTPQNFNNAKMAKINHNNNISSIYKNNNTNSIQASLAHHKKINFYEFNNFKIRYKKLKNSKSPGVIFKKNTLSKTEYNDDSNNLTQKQCENAYKKINQKKDIKKLRSINSYYSKSNNIFTRFYSKIPINNSFKNIQKEINSVMNNINHLMNNSDLYNNSQMKIKKKILNNSKLKQSIKNSIEHKNFNKNYYLRRAKNLSIGIISNNSKKDEESHISISRNFDIKNINYSTNNQNNTKNSINKKTIGDYRYKNNSNINIAKNIINSKKQRNSKLKKVNKNRNIIKNYSNFFETNVVNKDKNKKLLKKILNNKNNSRNFLRTDPIFFTTQMKNRNKIDYKNINEQSLNESSDSNGNYYLDNVCSKNQIKINIINNNINNINSNNISEINHNLGTNSLSNMKQLIKEDKKLLLQEKVITLSVIDKQKDQFKIKQKNKGSILKNEITYKKWSVSKKLKKAFENKNIEGAELKKSIKNMTLGNLGKLKIKNSNKNNTISNQISMNSDRIIYHRENSPQIKNILHQKTLHNKNKNEKIRNLFTNVLLTNNNTILKKASLNATKTSKNIKSKKK